MNPDACSTSLIGKQRPIVLQKSKSETREYGRVPQSRAGRQRCRSLTTTILLPRTNALLMTIFDIQSDSRKHNGGWVWNTTLYRQVGNLFPPLDDEPPSLSKHQEGLRSPASTRISVQMPRRAERRGGATWFYFTERVGLTPPVQPDCGRGLEPTSHAPPLSTGWA